MKKYNFNVTTGFVGCSASEDVLIGDKDSIQEIFEDWVYNQLDFGWEETEKKNNLRFFVSMSSYSNSRIEDEFVVEEDEDLEHILNEWLWENIEASWMIKN